MGWYRRRESKRGRAEEREQERRSVLTPRIDKRGRGREREGERERESVRESAHPVVTESG